MKRKIYYNKIIINLFCIATFISILFFFYSVRYSINFAYFSNQTYYNFFSQDISKTIANPCIIKIIDFIHNCASFFVIICQIFSQLLFYFYFTFINLMLVFMQTLMDQIPILAILADPRPYRSRFTSFKNTFNYYRKHTKAGQIPSTRKPFHHLKHQLPFSFFRYHFADNYKKKLPCNAYRGKETAV